MLAQISDNYIKFASCVNYITMDEIRKINRLKAVTIPEKRCHI